MMQLLETMVIFGDAGADILMGCNWLLGFVLKACIAGVTLFLILNTWTRRT